MVKTIEDAVIGEMAECVRFLSPGLSGCTHSLLGFVIEVLPWRSIAEVSSAAISSAHFDVPTPPDEPCAVHP
jgi:hypothetical protein